MTPLRDLQRQRLRSLLHRLENQSWYRRRLRQAGVRASRFRLRDLPGLPFTRKEDLRRHYPFGLFGVPLEQVRRIHASTGTTGQPTLVGYTAGDLDVFAEVNARSLEAAGARPGMMLHNAYGYGLFTGGLGLHAGAERLGMAVVPVSGGMTERQLRLILDLRPDVLTCTPSYAQTLAAGFQRLGVPPARISLRHALLGAEPWTEAIRAEVEAGLGLDAVNIYGLSEIIGPGVAQECLEGKQGSHVWEDHFYPEVVDPASGEPLDDGQPGVLVLTTLSRECQPLVRYWTGDLTRLDRTPCPCGRPHVRMGRVVGRTDDMLIVRGVNLYPSQVEEVLEGFSELRPQYQLVRRLEGALEELELRVEVRREAGQAADLSARLGHRLRDTLGLRIEVRLEPPGSLPVSEGGKLQRVVDQRGEADVQ